MTEHRYFNRFKKKNFLKLSLLTEVQVDPILG